VLSFREVEAPRRKLAQVEFALVGAGPTRGMAIAVAVIFLLVFLGLGWLSSRWSARLGQGLWMAGLIASGAIAQLARQRRGSGVDRCKVQIGAQEIVISDGAGGRRVIPHAAVTRVGFGNVAWKESEQAKLEIVAPGHGGTIRLRAEGVHVDDFWSQLDKLSRANKNAAVEPLTR
jgi:hypothetical protein